MTALHMILRSQTGPKANLGDHGKETDTSTNGKGPGVFTVPPSLKLYFNPWLRAGERIQFTLAVTVYRALHGAVPRYVSVPLSRVACLPIGL